MNDQSTQRLLLQFDQTLKPEDVLLTFDKIGEVRNRKGIAGALGCAKSPHLVSKIQECCQYGWLIPHMLRLPNGVDMFLYELTGSGYSEAARYLHELNEGIENAE